MRNVDRLRRKNERKRKKANRCLKIIVVFSILLFISTHLLSKHLDDYKEEKKTLVSAMVIDNDIVIENELNRLMINPIPDKKVVDATYELDNEFEEIINENNYKISQLSINSEKDKRKINKLKNQNNDIDYTLIDDGSDVDSIVKQLKNSKLTKIAINYVVLKADGVLDENLEDLALETNDKLNKCPYYKKANEILKSQSLEDYKNTFITLLIVCFAFALTGIVSLIVIIIFLIAFIKILNDTYKINNKRKRRG